MVRSLQWYPYSTQCRFSTYRSGECVVMSFFEQNARNSNALLRSASKSRCRAGRSGLKWARDFQQSNIESSESTTESRHMNVSSILWRRKSHFGENWPYWSFAVQQKPQHYLTKTLGCIDVQTFYENVSQSALYEYRRTLATKCSLVDYSNSWRSFPEFANQSICSH